MKNERGRNECLVDPLWMMVKERLDDRGIKAALFDVDDYLLQTHAVFQYWKEVFVLAAAKKLRVTDEVIRRPFEQINNEAFKTHHVNPLRWDFVVAETGRQLTGRADYFLPQLPLLKKIYETEIEWHPGAKLILDQLRQIEIRVGVVTHANVEWNRRKFDQTGMWNSIDGVVIADENGLKSEKDWQRGIEMLKVRADQVMGGGDSVPGDLIPLTKLGVNLVVGVPSPVGIYRGELPVEVKMLTKISEWPEVMAGI